MNDEHMRKKLFIALVTAFTFSVNGAEADGAEADVGPSFSSPARPARTAAALPNLTCPQINSLEKLMRVCFEQIQTVHAIFSTDSSMDDDKPRVAVVGILDTFTGLIPLFLERLNSEKGKHITPECRKALGTHLSDIAGNNPKDFLKKGDADFLASVDPKDFYSVCTHFGNIFFIPKWQTEPYFAFWRKSTNTLFGRITYERYNVLKLLKGENPESHSGVLEHHHVYQNQETVTPVCWSEHKGKTKQYHLSGRESKIDRSMCGTEFYYINKLTGLLQAASMCERVLRTVDDDKITHEAFTVMKAVQNYTGNIAIIFNKSEVSRKRARLEPMTSAHAGHIDEEEETASSSLRPFPQPSFDVDSDEVGGATSSSPSSSLISQDVDGENPPKVGCAEISITKERAALLPVGVNSLSSVATFS